MLPTSESLFCYKSKTPFKVKPRVKQTTALYILICFLCTCFFKHVLKRCMHVHAFCKRAFCIHFGPCTSELSWKINFSLQAGAYYEPFSMMSISSCGRASDRSSTDNARPSANLSLTCLKHSWSQRNACLAGLIVIQACLKARKFSLVSVSICWGNGTLWW